MAKLVTFEEAKCIVESNFTPVSMDTEESALLEAYNRVLSDDVISPIDLPSFRISDVEGYALIAQDTQGATEDKPITLKIVGFITVGEKPEVPLGKNEVYEISKGAMLPEGADTVIASYDVEREDDFLHVFASAYAGENVRKQGSDIKKDFSVLKKGQVLGPVEVGILAGLGLKQVKVLKLPTVGVISIGDEVNELNKPLQPGKIYDINAYALCTAIMECGAKAVYFGTAQNEKAAIQKLMNVAISSTDMLIVASSVDVTEIADSLGKPGIILKDIAVKPGKNTAIAFASDKPIFLFPNDPATALIMFQLFARSIVQRLAGRNASNLKTVNASLGSKLFSAKGSTSFVLVKLMFDEQCRLIAEQSEASGNISTLAESDGYVQIEANEEFLDIGQEITVHLLKGLAGRT